MESADATRATTPDLPSEEEASSEMSTLAEEDLTLSEEDKPPAKTAKSLKELKREVRGILEKLQHYSKPHKWMWEVKKPGSSRGKWHAKLTRNDDHGLPGGGGSVDIMEQAETELDAYEKLAKEMRRQKGYEKRFHAMKVKAKKRNPELIWDTSIQTENSRVRAGLRGYARNIGRLGRMERKCKILSDGYAHEDEALADLEEKCEKYFSKKTEKKKK